MAPDSEPKPPVRDTGQPWLRSALAFLVVALMIGTLLLVLDLYGENPRLDHPALLAIADATSILSRTYGDEKAVVDRFRRAHRQLASAVELLDRTERLDPADRREIEALRAQLRGLEDPDRVTSMDPGRLEDRYRELVRRLNALADKLAPTRS